MKIGGFQKHSLIDFPGRRAAVIYTQGCCWRCPYCHNRAFVNPARFQPAIPVDEVFDHLLLRREQLDAVVITGGEPTIQSGLADFLQRLREMDLQIKLDTNGSQPNVIARLLQENLLDFIAMDIKGPLCAYSRFTGCEVDTGPIEISIELIKTSNIPYEFRTTLVGGMHDRDHIAQLAPLMYGVRRYAVQTYRGSPGEAKSHDPFTEPDISLFHAASLALRDKVDEFVVR
ncbi:MAG: anaerobic ribonucleoside-triphosphate reductase activating protein [Nibricoccus sp.]